MHLRSDVQSISTEAVPGDTNELYTAAISSAIRTCYEMQRLSTEDIAMLEIHMDLYSYYDPYL